MKKCKNGHLYDPQMNTYCPQCPIEGLDLNDVKPKFKGKPADSVDERRDEASNFGAAGRRPGHKRTIAYYPGLGPSRGKPLVDVDPVVGWLIAHEGPALGRDFRIRHGNNSIGGDPDQAISISEDERIHGREHAFIVYDAKSNRFILRPGVQRGLVHLNGELVAESLELSPYADIEIGGSRLIFVPLCSESFIWSFDKDTKGDTKGPGQ